MQTKSILYSINKFSIMKLKGWTKSGLLQGRLYICILLLKTVSLDEFVVNKNYFNLCFSSMSAAGLASKQHLKEVVCQIATDCKMSVPRYPVSPLSII